MGLTGPRLAAMKKPGILAGLFLVTRRNDASLRALAGHDEWVAEMTVDEDRQERDRLKLPASSWWIPSLTIAIAILAVVAALA
ncbi:MAG TPA: hypothetical protein VNO69_04975 [Methyloceanibacter sp.]|jgi:hypothetical protein|nr:hypothetical protein [Methyloceanibacter sp.]